MGQFLLRLAGLGLAASAAAAPAYAATSYDMAASALARGDPRGARIELLNAIKANPQDGRAHLLQGRVYLELGDGLAADAEIRRAREHGIADTQTHHLLAHALLLQNQPERAIEESARAPHAFAPYALRIRGRAHAVMNDTAAAAVDFAAALKLAPRYADLWSDVGRLRIATGDLGGAKTAAQRAMALAPRDSDGLLLSGDLARIEGDVPRALAWYDRALKIDRNNVQVLLARAGALSDAGRWRDMLAVTRHVLSLDSKNPFAFHLQARMAALAGNFPLARTLLQRTGDALDNLPAAILLAGLIEYKSGNDEQAIERFGRVVGLQPGNAKARRLLAAAQLRAGDAEAAIATLQPVVARTDADRSSLMLMARALARRGDNAGALAYRRRAAEPSPQRLANAVVAAEQAARAGRWRESIRHYEILRADTGGGDASVLNNLAWAYGNAGEPGRALPVAEAAYARAPGHPSVIDTYGWFLHVSGRDAGKALRLLEAATAKAPANPTIRWHLAQAYADARRGEDARRELRSVLADPAFAERPQAEALLAKL